MNWKLIAIRWSVLLSFVMSLGFVTGCKKDHPIGSEKNPFKMYFVPAEDTNTIAISAKEIAKFLEKYISQKLYGKENGFYITTSIPTSFIAVVEAFGTKRADFAAINTFSYIMLKDRKKYPSEAILNVLRGDGESSYKGQIIAHVDSGIKTLDDLNGKRFAYTDPASTSGYVLPSILFKSKNINLGETTFATRHDNVVVMVYQGQVDAGATYYSPPVDGKPMDARTRVMSQYPDVLEKVKIIDFTKPIPNAPWVLREGLFGDDVKKYQNFKMILQDGMLEFAKTENGKHVLSQLYNITGLVRASDEDFKEVRDMFAAAQFDPENFLKKK